MLTELKNMSDDHQAFLVGGSVRDYLLGKVPDDDDIVVMNHPRNAAVQLADRIKGTLVELGKADMTVFRVVSGSHIFDISPPKGLSLADDLSRRDFTINAMAIDLSSGTLIDPLNGHDDLNRKIVKMVSEQSFTDDPLRLLRAFRMSAALNFDIETQTLSAITQYAPLIAQSAGERIRSELFKILQSSRAHSVISQMAQHRLLFEIFPELNALKDCIQNHHHAYDAFDHSLSALYHLEKLFEQYQLDKETEGLLKFSILLHDIGKPYTRTEDDAGNVHFYGHEKISADMADGICSRLRCSNSEKQFTDIIIRNHLRPLLLFQSQSSKAVIRFFMKFGEYSLLLLYHAIADRQGKGDACGEDGLILFAKDLMRQFELQFQPQSLVPPMITGHDLIEIFGLKPSPLFKQILTMMTEEQLAGAVISKEDALKLVEDFLIALPTPNACR